ncbi:hypothetical protein COCON_G00187740 [Conger conger]|uniref:Galectin n=1 Tax=Conger conger TaxID=82655 RepID=A0A9Q1HRZ7_CONCO|nr:hypothetical protein COCON_G00187740 [Conger conger]
MGGKVVVFNTFRNNCWETEERVHTFPFEEEKSFDLVFIVTQQEYQVYVNGCRYYAFLHRMPLEYVSAVAIHGDVSIQSGNITEGGGMTIQRRLGLGLMQITSIPYVGSIQGCLRVGIHMYFRGTIPQEMKSFTISLQYAEQEGSDTALLFNPQFDCSGGVVKFNSIKNGKPQSEEKIRRFPFQLGQDFELLFIISQTGYQAIVNGRPFHSFRHRMPVEHVNAVKITGDVSMQTLNLIRAGRGLRGLRRILVSKIPYVGPVYGGFRKWMTLYFRGTIPNELNRFAINLQCGVLEGCDIAFHFNPRFTDCGNYVVFNNFKAGGWQKEERVQRMPFKKGEDFLVTITIVDKGYQVTVDGQWFHFFQHRVPVEQVCAIGIKGDIAMKTIDSTGAEEDDDDDDDDEEGTPRTRQIVFTKTPHMGPIHFGLRAGMCLRFLGNISKTAKSFTIRLQYAEMQTSDTALYFQPIFEPVKMVVFNTMQNGKYNTEEKVYKMPFCRGNDFELAFFITSQGYQVFVDGKRFHFFKRCMAVEPVTTIKIDGEVAMATLNANEEEPEKEEVVVTRGISHLGPIYGGLRTGMSLYFKGIIPQNLDRLRIILRCGDKEDSNVAFIFSARFNSNEMVLNDFQNGAWGAEERPEKIPFKQGEEFEMLYTVSKVGYQVVVNGEEFCLFKHRLPMDQVTGILISEAAKVHTINIIHGGQEGVLGRLSQSMMVVNRVPHVMPVYGGLRAGMYLYFHGKVDDSFNSFKIKLQYGGRTGCDKAMCFIPVVESQKTTFNSFQDGKFGTEEKVDVMPFTKGQPFVILFIITSKAYQVLINGCLFYTFKHRMAVEQVSTLAVEGDVSIDTINMIGGGPGSIEGYRGLRNISVPTTPHVAPICGGLRTGTYIYFRGTVAANVFSINLQCAEMKSSDVALHFVAKKSRVEFNTLRNEKLEKREVVDQSPFAAGQEFEMIFIVTTGGYKVIVNGRILYFFKHRMKPEHVNAIKFSKGVSMTTVNMIKGGEGGMHPSVGKMVVTKTPCVMPVYGGFGSEMCLCFKGTIPESVNGFCINLKCGQVEGSDIAMKFNPQFETSVVVFDTFRNGSWEAEDRIEVMPLKRGEDFELLFSITLHGYQVIVNGRLFYMFRHRMPVSHVSVIEITGDVSVKDLDIRKRGEGHTEEPAEEGELTIPHVRPIVGSLRTGMYVYFKGTIPEDIKTFTFSLQYGQMKGCDKAFLMITKFEPSEVVQFKTFLNGKCGNKEEGKGMPFTKGADFCVHVFVTSKGYQVLINGCQFHLFAHRMPVEQVTALKIAGNVTVQTINTLRGGPGAPCQPGVQKMVVSSIPCVLPVLNGLRPGMFLYFLGIVPNSSKRFSINLKCAEMDSSDNVMHFNPRFDSNVVVFNTFRNGGWENEERPSWMPFSCSAQFEVVFIVTLKGYQVMVNGRQFHFFNHRMPCEFVTAIKICGDVCMHTMHIIERGPMGHLGQPGIGKMVINKIPHVGHIFGGLRKGMAFYFRGTIPENSNSFCIDLQNGQLDACDKAFRFNPQFKLGKIAFNSFRNGKFELEEKVNILPFAPGDPFELHFIVTSTGYQVKVNGILFYTFMHRMPAKYVSNLKITGDVKMETGDIMEGVEPEPEPVIPSFPSIGPISGLRTGTSLQLDGTIPKSFKSFSINLHCGPCGEAKNIALQFSAKCDSSEVTFNTLSKGIWREAEIVKEMPFEAGMEFQMVFVITSEGYQVKIDGQDFYFYKHYIPAVNVTALKFSGDVSIQTTNIAEGGCLIHGKTVMDANPFVQPIACGLKTGTYLYFRGKVDEDANRFSISLDCGEKKGCEKAIFFKPQFQPSEMVVFNSFQNGEWGKEEKVAIMPFKKGQNFEMVFIVTSCSYQLLINGRRFYVFKHRVAVDRVCAIRIGGDVTMEPINIIGANVQGYRGLHKTVVTRTPYVGTVYGGLRMGTYLHFQGTVHKNPNSFTINLQCGESNDSDTAFLFKPKFKRNEVVLYSLQSGKLQNKEVVQKMPFTTEKDFEVVYVITTGGYQVIVNGSHFCTFKHHIPVEHVSNIRVQGNVTMKTVNRVGGGEGCMHPRLGKMVVTKIPHMGPIYSGLKTGMFLLFHGTVPDEAEAFCINLQYGQMEGSDIAFHFNARFNANSVVLNTWRSSSWEEEVAIPMMPFTKGKSFELVYMITAEGYQVYYNGSHFYFFAHRMPVECVTAVNITGEVSMKLVNMTERGKGAPALPAPGPVVVSTTPHSEPINGGLRHGMYLYFKGTIPSVAKSFAINLQNSGMEGSDVALHVNPRFEESVVFNTCRSGSWEEEERPAEMPFCKGEDFELLIIVTTEGYQVIANGRQFHFFKHRMQVEQVSAVNIVGDVSLKPVHIVQSGPEQPGLGKIAISEIPHVSPIYGGLRPLMYLYFKGTCRESFYINLQNAEMEGSDIGIHLNHKLDSGVVVFNAFQNGGWGPEESVEGMLFNKDEEFEIVYIISSEGYTVNINGRQCHFFKHRMSVEQVSTIQIAGDVSMQTLNIIQAGQSEQGVPDDGKIDFLTVPYVAPMYGRLRAGTALYIQGTIPEDSASYTIGLQYGQKVGSDIAFLFTGRAEDEVVCNSCKDGAWGDDDLVDIVPFGPGDDFELVLVITEEGYQVVANGFLCHFFNHRMPVDQVCALNITQDITIHSVKIIKGEDVVIKKKAKKISREVESVAAVFKIGMALFFQGTIPVGFKSFTINLRCGEEKDSDIAFSFNPKCSGDEEVVVFNSFKGGSWETEDTVTEMPFDEGESFELVFFPTTEGYQVYVNRRKFHFFSHRIPMERVTTLEFLGIIMLASNCIAEKEIQREDEDDDDDDDDDDDTALSLVPSLTPLLGGFKPDMSVCIRGTKNNKFYIDFQCGEADKALRFHSKSQGTVLNSCQGGIWGTEETVDKSLLVGEQFFLTFKVTIDSYEVIVNGTEACTFKHRVEMEKVTAIKVLGDVTIDRVGIIELITPEPVDEPVEEIEVVQCETAVEKSFNVGTTLTFLGIVPDDTKSFSVNLCGNDPDIAFHFRPLFETSEVVFNTFRNGSWEEAEKVDSMPFTKGENFELVYIITTEGYQVNVNGNQFHLYHHRMPEDPVRAIRVTGDISVTSVNVVEGAKEYPSPAELGTVQSETAALCTWKEGTSVTFLGRIPDEFESFSINLCGNAPDIAFHFRPIFETSEVVFNTFRNGSWEEAEKVDSMPFTKGETFEMTYIITAVGYLVKINGTEFYTYKCRMEVAQVSTIKVLGDIFIKVTDVQEPVPVYPLPAQLGPVMAMAHVSGMLKTGMSVLFQGVMPMEIDRFCINLQCGDTDNCDTAFHFSPLFETSEVVFNTFRNGSWEEAEKVDKMPFTKGEKFELLFVITEEGYQVNVNANGGLPMFKHRIGIEHVHTIQVIGITLEAVIQEKREYPVVAELGPVQSMASVAGSLKPGISLSFEGSIPESITCFCINLLCGEEVGSDIAFNFRPQFDVRQVLFNTYRHGWEEAEKASEMPFIEGKSFVLLINITSEGYQVAVNGNELYFFKHRIALENVVAMQIIGDVQITTINIVETAPSVTPLPGGLKEGTSLTFLGMMPPESSEFSIDLRCGTEEGCDTAFHFCPQDERVVFNSFKGGSWETEVTFDKLPFTKGENFEIVFLVNKDGYQVTVDDEEICMFTHRIPVTEVRALQISGNVSLPTVNIIEGAIYDQGGLTCFETVVVAAPIFMPIPSSFKKGTSVKFNIGIPEQISCFSIEMMCGDSPGCNKALKFCCHFEPSEEVTFNSFQSDSWGQEEKAAVMPFRKGETFDLDFKITDKGYKVKANGSTLHTFVHRIAVKKVTGIQIVGGIDLKAINIVQEGPCIQQGALEGITVSQQGSDSHLIS